MFKVDGGFTPQIERTQQPQFKPQAQQSPPDANSVTVKPGEHRLSGSLTRHRLNLLADGNPTNAPGSSSPGEQIARLRDLSRNLPPEDRQAVQNEITRLEKQARVESLQRLLRETRGLPPEDRALIQQDLTRAERDLELEEIAANPARIEQEAAALIARHTANNRVDYAALRAELAADTGINSRAGNLLTAQVARQLAEPAPVEQQADALIDNNGGRSDFDHEAAGRELAELARLSPAAAEAVLNSMLGKVEGDDRDEITQSFADSMSDAELSTLARDPAGQRLLETARAEILSDNVHDDEEATADRIGRALDSATNTLDEQLAASAEVVRGRWAAVDDDPTNQSKMTEAARALASEIERLNALHGPEAGGRLIAQLFAEDPKNYSGLMPNILSFAADLPSQQQTTVANAAGQAFASMGVEDQQKFAELVANMTAVDAFPGWYTMDERYGVVPRRFAAEDTGLAQIIALSGNNELKQAVAAEMIDQAASGEGLRDQQVRALVDGATILALSMSGNERAEAMTTIIDGLSGIDVGKLDDPALKDRLSQLFIESGEDFLHHVAPDGAYSSDDTQEGLIKFFELTLFSEHPGALRGDLMNSVIDAMKDVGDASRQPPISEAAYAATHGGWSQVDHAEAIGGFAGAIWKAAENQKEAIQKSREARAATANLFVGMAFSFIPGAGSVIGQLAQDSHFLENLAHKAATYVYDQATSHFQENVQGRIASLLEGDALENVDEILGNMKELMLGVGASLPNGEDGEGENLRVIFQAAFAFYNLI